uniref:Uncharacterized protein n=1 Tax=Romanomermis culicivorax TaxID=13658 RepID=A0A915J9K2_ROMCU
MNSPFRANILNGAPKSYDLKKKSVNSIGSHTFGITSTGMPTKYEKVRDNSTPLTTAFSLVQ